MGWGRSGCTGSGRIDSESPSLILHLSGSWHKKDWRLTDQQIIFQGLCNALTTYYMEMHVTETNIPFLCTCATPYLWEKVLGTSQMQQQLKRDYSSSSKSSCEITKKPFCCRKCSELSLSPGMAPADLNQCSCHPTPGRLQGPPRCNQKGLLFVTERCFNEQEPLFPDTFPDNRSPPRSIQKATVFW